MAQEEPEECARVAIRKDPHLNEFYTRLRHKRGEKKAHSGRQEAHLLRVLDAQEEHNLRGAVSLETT